ncbi:MAG: hypothetical protein K2N48_13900 [Muribaculaceae bacterium]|nr:hypothetical protein [Muribaculaceae bacterium]
MKKYILASIMMVINLLVIASTPQLASVKFFDDLDLYDPSLSITIVERKDKIVRSVTFKNKPDLLKKIQKALAIDKEKAVSKSLVTDNGEISESVVIVDDNEEIKIGLTNSKSQEIYFFVKIVTTNNHKETNTSSQQKRATKYQKKNKSKQSTRSKKSARQAYDNSSDRNEMYNMNIDCKDSSS